MNIPKSVKSNLLSAKQMRRILIPSFFVSSLNILLIAHVSWKIRALLNIATADQLDSSIAVTVFKYVPVFSIDQVDQISSQQRMHAFAMFLIMSIALVALYTSIEYFRRRRFGFFLKQPRVAKTATNRFGSSPGTEQAWNSKTAPQSGFDLRLPGPQGGSRIPKSWRSQGRQI